jgi:hypothetical protein
MKTTVPVFWNVTFLFYFIFLTVTCSSTTHRGRVVAFMLQLWLRERAVLLRYTYVAHLVKDVTNFISGHRIDSVLYYGQAYTESV